MIDSILRQDLIRNYYFAEALAIYEAYYRPLISSYAPARQELADEGRHDDRPPTWVPLVFHCTTEDRIEKIFADGILQTGGRSTVSFTEIPIGELDRMKYRHHGAEQVAIGFPRRYIESLGLTPVWYLKHNPGIREILAAIKENDPDLYLKLSPYIDDTGDVSPFQEVRTTNPVNMAEAVWILTTKRTSDTPRPVVPGIDKFQAEHGRIPMSYWHRSHQLGILSEWQFTSFTENGKEVRDRFEFIGEYYWRQETTQIREFRVKLPAHDKNLIFEVARLDKHAEYQGPWRLIDVARYIARLLLGTGESLDTALQYRLITDIAESSESVRAMAPAK